MGGPPNLSPGFFIPGVPLCGASNDDLLSCYAGCYPAGGSQRTRPQTRAPVPTMKHLLVVGRVILGLYWGYIRIILGYIVNHGKEKGSYYSILGFYDSCRDWRT